MDSKFLSTIKSRPLIFDGAMGTVIYQRGVFVHACYDDLCTTQPKLISDIHRDYVAAGAEVIETNTFGANRIRLAEFGLAEKTAEINQKAVQLACEAAGESVFVAGSCGPCSKDYKTFNTLTLQKIESAFYEQCNLLAENGCDAILLETFHLLEEVLLAARCARKTGIPVIASISPALFEYSPRAEALSALNASPDIDVIGINCALGPAEMLEVIQSARPLVSKPLIVMPNAGGPHEIGGRALYLNSPEYFTEYAKKYIDIGVNGVGGCCGTTPAHIRMAAQALHGLSGIKQHIEISAPQASSPDRLDPVPFAEKSSFAAKLATGQKITSIEMLPPRNTEMLPAFLDKCRLCEDAGIDAINLPDGPRASARMSVIATAAAMRMAKLNIEAIPHCCCRDRNLIGLQSDIIGGVALGLNTWLFITGDPPKLGNYPDATGVFDVDAIGLSQLCSNLNCGLDAAGQSIGTRTPIVTGVGVNPAAVDLDREIERYYAKINAGAEYAITQPVFDAEALIHFLNRISSHSPCIPVIIGLYPLLSAKNAEFMKNHVPGVHVPDSILTRMHTCTTKEDGIAMGIQIAREIRKTILSRNLPSVAGFQISAPLGRTDIALSVLKEA